jgi:hypothetical protein
MTMIVGVVTPRFALLATDTMGIAPSGLSVPIQAMTAQGPLVGVASFPPGQKFQTKKYARNDGHRDIFGFSGNAANHAKWSQGVMSLRGFACDEFLSSEMFKINKFAGLPEIPRGTSLACNSCLHLWEVSGQFIMTKIEAHELFASRETVRGPLDGAKFFVIGSGANHFDAKAAEWTALIADASATVDAYVATLAKVYIAVAARDTQVGAEQVVLVLRPGGFWDELLTEGCSPTPGGVPLPLV